MKLTLAEKRRETSDVVSFVFTPETPVEWKAGQFLTMVVPHENPDSHGIEHYFTISAAPYEKHVQITTRLTGSTFKNALNSLPIGGQVEMTGVDGDFLLENPSGEYVFIAGGIGITPFHSILNQLAHEGKPVSALMLYGNRTEDAVFKEELEDYVEAHPNLRIQYILAPQVIDEAHIRAAVPDLQAVTFYVSGPEPMVEALEKVMAAMGIAEDKNIRDYFPGYDEHNF